MQVAEPVLIMRGDFFVLKNFLSRRVFRVILS